MNTKTTDIISNQPQPVTILTMNVVLSDFNDSLKSLKKLYEKKNANRERRKSSPREGIYSESEQ